LNIIVCLKQVPETRDVRIDPQTGSLIRAGVPSIINPEYSNDLEEAFCLREQHGGNVVAISMGPPQAEVALRDALAMGGDEAILLCDKAFAGADTLATSFTLGSAIKKLGHFDLILCGTKTLDGNTGQVGAELGEFLDLPQITYARRLEIQGEMLRAERAFEEGYELMETRLPALVTVIREINEPRIPSIEQIMQSYREKEVKTWGAAYLGLDEHSVGLNGSATKMGKMYKPEFGKGQVELIEGSMEDMVQGLLAKLKERNLI
jgi:electron transfer flavoprotein alpha/beta subunit